MHEAQADPTTAPKKILFVEYPIIQTSYEEDIIRDNQDRQGAFGVEKHESVPPLT